MEVKTATTLAINVSTHMFGRAVLCKRDRLVQSRNIATKPRRINTPCFKISQPLA